MSAPIWKNNLHDAILLDPLILVHGNVKDLYCVAHQKRKTLPAWLQDCPYVPFDVWLALEFEQLGFPVVLLYDIVDGIVALRGSMIEKVSAMIKGQDAEPSGGEDQANHGSLRLTTSDEASSGTPDEWMAPFDVKQEPDVFFKTLYDKVFLRDDAAIAVVCRFTDRYLSFTDRQDMAEKKLSLLIQKAATSIPPPRSDKPTHCRIALLFDLEGSIPQELSVQAPFAHSVRIPSPSLEEREQFFIDNYQQFASEPNDRFDPEQNSDELRDVANLSDGLKTQDLLSLIALSKREGLGLGKKQVRALLGRFKFGSRENAWEKIPEQKLRNAKVELRNSVKGQDEVIDEVVPTLIRAKLGMTEMGSSSRSNKPRGVFFFVGPTGVGKTELTKAIAQLIFGDPSAMIRFDMSEYSEEHQQARLVGAPPGYVGFDQGGQLTNAITEKPFSVVLFDEIEKAHGRILDKFLQIIDDGRLTDGMGRTVYFSEAILIFTSNIGTSPRQGGPASGFAGGHALSGPASAATSTAESYSKLGELSYEQLSEHFRREVKNFFVNDLGRPEILNRIGEDNILVFNFLNDEGVKSEIVEKIVKELDAHLLEKYRIGLYLTKKFKRLLFAHPSGFERNGARGVRNILSKLVLNKLAEDFFLDRTACQDKLLRVDYRVNLDEIGEGEFEFERDKLKYTWEDRSSN